MAMRSEPFMFSDLEQDEHGTMVFALAEPGKPNDLFVKLDKSFAVEVEIPRMPTSASRRITGGKPLPRASVREVRLNAVRLRDGEFTNIPDNELIYAVKGVDEVDGLGESDEMSDDDGNE